MDITATHEEIREKLKGDKPTRELAADLKQRVAEYLCPFAVGQRVKSDERGECEIAQIRFCWGGRGYILFASKVNKRGKVSLYAHTIHHPEKLESSDYRPKHRYYD